MIEFIKDNFLYITAIITSMKWVYEYSNKLNWDRNKFLIDRLESFMNDKNTQNVQMMLDWNRINIYDGDIKYEIDDQILFEALQTHDEKNSFDKTELYIRKAFDEYLDGLTEFVILSESKMVNEKNLRSFLSYWIKILNGQKKNKPKKLSNQFSKYLEFYEFDKLKKFINKPNNIYYYFNFYYLYNRLIKKK